MLKEMKVFRGEINEGRKVTGYKTKTEKMVEKERKVKKNKTIEKNYGMETMKKLPKKCRFVYGR